MGREISPARHPWRRRTSRAGLAAALVGLVVVLSGCSAEGKNEVQRLAMPVPLAKETQNVYDMWHWTWLAAMIVGVAVWALIFYAVIHFRRRSPDEIPVQTRYNLPIEIFYTAAPVMIVIVLFFFTVKVQDEGPAGPEVLKTPPDHTVLVVGQQWSWTFNYTDEKSIGGQTVYDGGTTSDIPTIWLPVDQKIRFNLYSPDVIHDFNVPAFLFKMDVVPGRSNHFTLTPERIGKYVGKCAELCGAYHSRMLFNLKVVSVNDYEAHLKTLLDQGNIGPVTGAKQTRVEAGLESQEASQ